MIHDHHFVGLGVVGRTGKALLERRGAIGSLDGGGAEGWGHGDIGMGPDGWGGVERWRTIEEWTEL
eukprot:6500232-Pyramimonas_sp.AAC.1